MTTTLTPLIIYAEKVSPRLTYVLDFIFKAKGQNYQITTLNDIPNSDLAYSKTKSKTKLNIEPSGLLHENNINKKWQISFTNNEWLINDLKDDLSIIFYFLSRYEEYTDKTRDEYGRYTANQSILFKNNQLHQPWCDILVKQIWEKLGLDYQPIVNNFTTILTYDIDIAWAYKYKPLWRTIANVGKNIFNPTALKERQKVVLGKAKDPYDSYAAIKKAAKKHPTMLFFLLGNYGTLDKNHHWKNNKLQALIQSFKGIAEAGIHPSFNSFLKTEKVKEECNRLANITGEPTKFSRQHYLRFNLPESYQLLLKANIQNDFSMGYAEFYGFRAGTSFSFPFFDLSVNKCTALQITPFTFMDGTLREYLNLTPNEAIEVITELKKAVSDVGGQFIPLWHNHSISNQKEWEGWQAVFEFCSQ